MIRKSSVLAANDEFWHSAIVDDSNASTNDSSDEQTSSLATSDLPATHHQLLSSDVPSYECLTGHDHRGDDTSAALFFDDGDDMLSATHDDDEENGEVRMNSCFRQEKMSSVKKRGGGSWLLGFARLQSRLDVDEHCCDNEGGEEISLDQENDDTPPGLVRTNSVSDFSYSTSSSSEDDNSTTTSSCSSDNDSLSPKKKSVGFNSTVKIQPIPHSSTYSAMQRRKMYSSSLEVRKNKIRNKKEYRYDGYDWRNVTEEWEMNVDMVTGELVHPVHNHML